MATWAIGDIQGCHDELARLIETIKFDPANDRLWFCGDLVNRGGQSLAVLRLVKSFGDAAIVVLGNHDLSLLAVGERKREDQQRVNPELREVLFAPDRDELLDWLRRRNLLHLDRSFNFL
ncbi:MAG TPA: metallophosphoesterase, partial [Rhodanobacteraceae bacterium]